MVTEEQLQKPGEEETEEGAINHGYITNYIRASLPPHEGYLKELEEYAKENHVPIIQPEVGRFMEVLCSILRPKTILEVGTAIGYSASLMYFASGTQPHITTIERYDKMVGLAKENLAKAGISDHINLIEGDAVEVLDELEGSFDLIFLDAAKGQYPHFLKNCIRLLRPEGVLLCDNVLYKGMTAEKKLVIRRKITIVKRLRKFIDEIMHCDALDTSLMPLGDGVTISRKRSTEEQS